MTRRSGGHFGRATHIDPLPTTSMRMKMRVTSTTFKSQSENLRMSLESHLKTGSENADANFTLFLSVSYEIAMTLKTVPLKIQ